jgi:pimeloyl-ACP methyl ester carboxylesterase
MSDTTDPIAAPAASFKSGYFPAKPGVELRVLQWQPDSDHGLPPVVFVAGWVSVIQGWADLIRELSSSRSVYYIETREKGSARVDIRRPKPTDFGIEAISEDLVEVCKNLPIKMSDSNIMASSLGATALLEALKGDELKPRSAFLIAPNSDFPAPTALKSILYLPAQSYHFMKHFVLWYLRNFRVDAKAEPEQMARYDATLLEADPVRIKLSCKAFMDYQVWDRLDSVDLPIGLANAPTDKLHGVEKIERMARTLPQGQVITCPTNKYLHSGKLVSDFDKFIASLNG